MTDADGADFPPEDNPDYKEMHERDFGLAPGIDWEHPFLRRAEKIEDLRFRERKVIAEGFRRARAAQARWDADRANLSETLTADDDALD
jgi:hypothetical protein